METASDSNDIPDENAKTSLVVVARGGEGYPAVAWTDRRAVSNKNIFYSTLGHTYMVDTSPSGLQVTVDGAIRQTPVSLAWVSGSTHTVEAPAELMTEPETKLTWQSWSDSGTRMHSVVSGTPPTSLVASYSRQYKITVLVNPSTLVLPQQGGWFADGAEVTFSAPSPIPITAGQRYSFSHWSGNASGSEPTKHLVADTPLTVQANYERQFFVNVTSDRGNPTDPAWVDQGQDFIASVTSPAEEAAGKTRFTTKGYRVDGGTQLAGTSYTFVDVQAPHSITFYWAQQFYLSLNASAPGIPVSGGGWYDSGATANISVTSLHQVSSSERYQFMEWASLGPVPAPIASPSSPQTTVAMSSYFTVQANVEHQYLLSAGSNPPDLVPQPSGGGWRTAGVTAVLTAPAVAGYTFEFWIVDAEVKPQGQYVVNVEMSAAHSATAVYSTPASPTPTASPTVSPTVSPTTTPTSTPTAGPTTTTTTRPTTTTTRTTTTTTRPPATPTPSPSPVSPSPTGTPTTSTTTPGGFLPALDITSVGLIVGVAAAAVAVVLLFLRLRRLGPFKK